MICGPRHLVSIPNKNQIHTLTHTVIELLGPLQQLLQLACEKRAGKGAAAAGDESALLHANSYGKWACLVDEFVPAGGMVEHVDVDLIERLAKAKPLS